MDKTKHFKEKRRLILHLPAGFFHLKEKKKFILLQQTGDFPLKHKDVCINWTAVLNEKCGGG